MIPPKSKMVRDAGFESKSEMGEDSQKRKSSVSNLPAESPATPPRFSNPVRVLFQAKLFQLAEVVTS